MRPQFFCRPVFLWLAELVAADPVLCLLSFFCRHAPFLIELKISFNFLLAAAVTRFFLSKFKTQRCQMFFFVKYIEPTKIGPGRWDRSTDWIGLNLGASFFRIEFYFSLSSLLFLLHPPKIRKFLTRFHLVVSCGIGNFFVASNWNENND